LDALPIYLAAFGAGLAYAFWIGFGASLAGFGIREEPARSLGRTFVAALVTGFGGAGALLTGEGRLHAPAVLGLATLTAFLFAGLTVIATRIALDRSPRG